MRSPVAIGGLAALASCAPAPAGPGLVDVTEASGVALVHDNGYRGAYAFPETMGSGVALVDLDGDGDLELYAVQGGPVPGTREFLAEASALPTNRLFENRGDGSFEDATERAGDAAHSGCGMGVCAGDVDGDGRTDLFVTNVGADALLVNAGGLEFEDRAPGTPLADELWTTACGFADLDRDGHLDLVSVGYVRMNARALAGCDDGDRVDYCDIQHLVGERDRVFRGDGRGGFAERTHEWGLGESRGKGLGLALVDFDDDGDVDLYVANDTQSNRAFTNDGTGALEDTTARSGAGFNIDGRPEAGMGVGVSDVNGDALPDLLVTNFAGESNTLYASAGEGRYRDRSRSSGLTALSRRPLGFGCAFADFDLDGHEDLVVTNGHVARHVEESSDVHTYAQADQLFRADGAGRFVAWEAGPALASPRVGRGLAVGDVDGDGAPDLVLHGSGEPLRLLRNGLETLDATTVCVELTGSGSNTSAVGARVQLELEDGSRATRWVRSGTGYLSQDPLRPAFAVPAGRRAVAVHVRWPDGAETREDLGSGPEGNPARVAVRR